MRERGGDELGSIKPFYTPINTMEINLLPFLISFFIISFKFCSIFSRSLWPPNQQEILPSLHDYSSICIKWPNNSIKKKQNRRLKSSKKRFACSTCQNYYSLQRCTNCPGWSPSATFFLNWWHCEPTVYGWNYFNIISLFKIIHLV